MLYNGISTYLFNVDDYKQKSKKFYSMYEYDENEELLIERMIEIDKKLVFDRNYLMGKTKGNVLYLTDAVYDKLIASAKHLNLNTSNEVLYYLVRVVDPEFLFLQIYEKSNTKQELKKLCMENFKFFDQRIINVEKKLNKLLSIVDTYNAIDSFDNKKRASR